MSIKIKKATQDDAPFLAKMILQSSRAEKKVCILDMVFDAKTDKEVLDKLSN